VIDYALSSRETSPKLVALVYELLDAHEDTTRISQEPTDAEGWAAHLDYLRQLQRVGREFLAETDGR
jgi:hypothetical protein